MYPSMHLGNGSGQGVCGLGVHPPETATEADGAHPSGMLTC